MKILILASLMSLFCLPAMATAITAAEYDQNAEVLTLGLVYVGGLKNHNYTLEYDSCQQIEGVQEVSARLLDSGHDDAGSREIHQSVQFSLKNLSCKPSWLTVRSGLHSFVTIWIE